MNAVHKPMLALNAHSENREQKNAYARIHLPSCNPSYGGMATMDVLLERCAGMDVHKESIVVCVLTTDVTGEIHREVRTFGTMTKHLFELLKFLETHEVTHVAMESTGVYWKPVYNILEGYFTIVLAHAQRIKNVPGRKTDVCDSEWIAKLLRVGLIEPSFVPSEDLRELRDLCRLRKKRIGSLTAEKNRIQKYLEASNIKLKSVISDVFGVSGRNLLKHLIEKGYVDPEEISESVKGSVKNKKAEVADSLFGTITPHQINLIKDCWEHIEYLEQSLARLEEEMDNHLAPYREEYELLQTIPGVSERTAAAIIAEIGVDMAPFPTAAHLASWAGVAPGNHESAGKKKHKKHKRQPSCKSSTMRSVLGNRSLTKNRIKHKVLENCIQAR